MKFKLNNGADGLFVVSHSTKEIVNPEFEYRFTGGTVSFNSTEGNIIGKFADGTVKEYGDPSKETCRKIYWAIAGCRDPEYVPVCGVQAAAPQVRCVEKIQTHPILPVREDLIQEQEKDGSHFLYVEQLDALLRKCYEEEQILSAYPQLKGLVTE